MRARLNAKPTPAPGVSRAGSLGQAVAVNQKSSPAVPGFLGSGRSSVAAPASPTAFRPEVDFWQLRPRLGRPLYNLMVQANFQPLTGAEPRPFEPAEGMLAAAHSEMCMPEPRRRRRAAGWADQTLRGLLEELAPRCQYNPRELARELGISARHLQRLFAAAFGRPPRDWLNEHRLLRARQLLQSAGSVKEVAYALGFRGVSQFSRDFRVRFGVVPSALLGRRELPRAEPGPEDVGSR